MNEEELKSFIVEHDLPAELSENWRRFNESEYFSIFQEGVEFRCPMTTARRTNMALQQISHDLLKQREVSLPHIVHVGVTTLCNLKCPACPTGTKALGRPGEHLAYKHYADMLQEIGDTLMFLLFWDWGEPLMHPRLVDMLALAKSRGIKTIVSTNGTVANSERQIERLVESGLDYIIVCVDGATQESFEKYRVGGNLQRVLETIQRLSAVRKSLGRAYPVIEFRSLATRYNEQEFPQLLELAQLSGADIFSVKSLRPYDYRGHSVDVELAPLTDRFARYKYGESGGRDAGSRVYQDGPLCCGKPMFAPTLNSDGQLAFCSYASYADEIFGGFQDTGFIRCWGSAQSRGKRLNFHRKGGTRSCQRCYFRTDHKPTVLYTVQLNELPKDICLQAPIMPQDFLAEYGRIMSAS